MDIPEVPRRHLLQQMSQKLFQRSVTHELAAYLSNFYFFLTQWNGYIIKSMQTR